MKNLLLIAVAVLLAACSSKPSDSEIESLVKERLSGEMATVENFQKTNGFEKDKNTYVADVTYDLVFKKSFAEMAAKAKAENAGKGFMAEAQAEMAIGALKMAFGEFEAGKRVKKNDKAVFIKTEKGWQIGQ